MIDLFDANFLSILLHPKARVPGNSGLSDVDARARIKHLIATASQKRCKVIIPAPALAEFMLLAGNTYVEYLRIIQGSSVFKIEPFDELAAIGLVEYCGGLPKPRRSDRKATWAKLKYDNQIAAIAKFHRVRCIYTTDSDLHTAGKRLGIETRDIKDLAAPPPEQMALEESVFDEKEQAEPSITRLQRGAPGPTEGETGAEANHGTQNEAQAKDS